MTRHDLKRLLPAALRDHRECRARAARVREAGQGAERRARWAAVGRTGPSWWERIQAERGESRE